MCRQCACVKNNRKNSVKPQKDDDAKITLLCEYLKKKLL